MPLRALDGLSTTPTNLGRPRIQYPFSGYPTPDKYASILSRLYKVSPSLTGPGGYTPRIAERTSYTNLRTYSSDLSNAAWVKTNVSASMTSRNPQNGATDAYLLADTSG